MQTIVELNEYLRKAEKLLSAEQRNEIVTYLAFHPKAGALIQGTGGIRKLRWRREGKGKSGGVRVVYYYHDESIPTYLLTIFAKGDRENLSKAERNNLAKLAKQLLNNAKRRYHHG
jgi:hypothetical protein